MQSSACVCPRAAQLGIAIVREFLGQYVWTKFDATKGWARTDRYSLKTTK